MSVYGVALRRVGRWTFGLVAVLAVMVLRTAAATGEPIEAVTAEGGPPQQIATFDSATPGTLHLGPGLTGQQMNEVIKAIVVDPATGDTYALGSTSRVYKLNTVTGVLTQVGSGQFGTLLSGNDFGMSFDPVAGDARIVSETGQNLSLNLTTGADSADTSLAYDSSDPNKNDLVKVVDVANTPLSGGATTTFGYNSADNTLVRIGSPGGSPTSPGAGTLFTVGSSNITTSLPAAQGLAISPATGTAYFATFNTGTSRFELWTLNPTTGAGTSLGNIGNGMTSQLEDIALAPPPPPAVTFQPPGPIDFGSVSDGSTSQSRTITVKNTGGFTLHINMITTSGPFAKVAGDDNCSGQSVAPGNQCSLPLVFLPTTPGPASGSMSVSDDAPGSPQTVDLSGTGSAAPTCPGFPELGRPCADVFINFTKPPKSVYGEGQVISFAYAAGNNGPDPSEITIISVVLRGGGIDSSSTVTLPAPTPAQESNVESGRVFVDEKGSATIERVVSGSVPDPVGSNNSVDATVGVYPFPDSTAEPPGADVKGGGGGQLGGSTDSCGEAKPPVICSGGDDECVDTQGCVQSHHDVCEKPTGELGVCGPPPPAVCAPSAATCSSPKLAQRPVLGWAAPAVPTAVQAASGFNPALERVSKVRVALVAVGKGGHAAAAKPCRWLTAKGKLRARACNKPVWVKAKGTTHWKLHVPPLPRGSYVAYVQAANAAGIAEDTFGPKDRNRIAFRVR